VPGLCRRSAVTAAGVLAVVTFGSWAQPAGATASASAGATAAAAAAAGASVGTAPAIGPVQINALGHPGLCWQAGGNGSAVTLERCDAAVQGQQWSLTSDGVVMNGNGYCLEAGTGLPLYIDFAGQCAGDAQAGDAQAGDAQAGDAQGGQVWRYRAGLLASAGTGACAVAGGPLWPGTEVVRRACSARASQWSIGYSAVTVAPGSGSGAAGSGAAAGVFGAAATVANAASAQTAYGVTVAFVLPPHSAAAGLRLTGGSRWSCGVRTLTCTGTLPAGASSRIAIAGRLPAGPRSGDSYTVRVKASVTGTSQRPGTTRTTASLTVAVHAAALAAPGTPGAPGALGAAAARSPLLLVAAVAGVLLLAGALLIRITRRTRPPARHSLPR